MTMYGSFILKAGEAGGREVMEERKKFDIRRLHSWKKGEGVFKGGKGSTDGERILKEEGRKEERHAEGKEREGGREERRDQGAEKKNFEGSH